MAGRFLRGVCVQGSSVESQCICLKMLTMTLRLVICRPKKKLKMDENVHWNKLFSHFHLNWSSCTLIITFPTVFLSFVDASLDHSLQWKAYSRTLHNMLQTLPLPSYSLPSRLQRHLEVHINCCTTVICCACWIKGNRVVSLCGVFLCCFFN